jgi:hypothetical protein
VLRLAVLLAIVIAGCGGGNEWSEQQVAAGITKITQDRLDRNPSAYGEPEGMRVRHVTCVKAEARTFHCSGVLANGDPFAATAHVSEDGEHLVTEGS